MMLSEKLKDATVTVPFGLAELDGPPVEPHEVVTRARAAMLAPRTKIRFRTIHPPPKNARESTRPPPHRVLSLSVPPSGLMSMDEARPASPGAGPRPSRIRRSTREWRP